MIKTKYTIGFEKFWEIWRYITGKPIGKPEAFRYWKRDKLEKNVDELIRILNLQQAERIRFKAKGEWIPEWCFCCKWLNKRRYEYVPEPPKKREVKAEPLTEEEIKRRAIMNTPESRKAKAEYDKLKESMVKKMTPTSTMPSSDFNSRRNKALKALKER